MENNALPTPVPLRRRIRISTAITITLALIAGFYVFSSRDFSVLNSYFWFFVRGILPYLLILIFIFLAHLYWIERRIQKNTMSFRRLAIYDLILFLGGSLYLFINVFFFCESPYCVIVIIFGIPMLLGMTIAYFVAAAVFYYFYSNERFFKILKIATVSIFALLFIWNVLQVVDEVRFCYRTSFIHSECDAIRWFPFINNRP